MTKRLIQPATHWTYKAPPTPGEGPPGFTGNWFALSPGMRREIWRQVERETARIAEATYSEGN
jgi:hypothetical protein